MTNHRPLADGVDENCPDQELLKMLHPSVLGDITFRHPASTLLLLQKVIDGQEEILRELRRQGRRKVPSGCERR